MTAMFRSGPRRPLPIDLPEAMLLAVSLLALVVALAALVRVTFLLHP